jgi:tetratricopeptide (TPR) repeat protein
MKALELDPMNPLIHNNAGLLFLHTKQGGRAVDSLETAVELYDNQAPAFVYNNLGLAHEQVGHYEEAREAFEEALLVSPFYARAKVNLRRIETTIASISEQNAFQTAQGGEEHRSPR